VKIHVCSVAALLLAAPLAVAAHGSAHQHGVGTLDIAVDARSISVQFDTPLDNLVGFERAPRTDAERQRVNEAVTRLKDGDKLFKFDPAAGCKLAASSLDSPVLGVGGKSATATQGHAELHASWEFDCADAGKATHVDVGLFAFRQLKRLQVQLVLPKAQFKRELKTPFGRLVLGP
jgi:hypothetical protein